MVRLIAQRLQENCQDGSFRDTFLTILLQRKKNSAHDDFDKFRLFLNPIFPKTVNLVSPQINVTISTTQRTVPPSDDPPRYKDLFPSEGASPSPESQVTLSPVSYH